MKTPGQDRGASRREFLRGSTRYGLLSLFAITIVAVRKDLSFTLEQECLNRGVCPGCSAFKDCGLPAALSAKRTTEGD
jgi:hypothetical protein